MSQAEVLDNDPFCGPDLVADATLPGRVVSSEHCLVLLWRWLQLLYFKSHRITLNIIVVRTLSSLIYIFIQTIYFNETNIERHNQKSFSDNKD